MTELEPDPEKRDMLREIADDIRNENSEARQLSALLYRVSDLYDAEEDTSPREIYLNMRNILRVKEQGGRDPNN